MKTQLVVAVMTLGLIACGNKGPGGAGGGSGGSTGGGSTGGGAHGGGTGGSTGGGAHGGGTGGGTGGSGGAGGSSAAGSSCTNPLTATLGTQAPMAILNTVGKKIYFRVPVMAADFLVLFTNANPMDDVSGAKTDATITIYNEAGTTVLASLDDAFPRLNTDTTLYYRAAATGNLCVMVTDYDTWATTGMSAAHTDDVKLTIAKLDGTSMLNNIDTGSNNDAANAQVGKFRPFAVGTSGGFSNVYGTFDSQSDVDVYKFTMPAGVRQFIVTFAPLGDSPAVGTNTYGSTLSRIAVKITDTSGIVVGALSFPTNLADLTDSIGVPVTEATDYLLWVERPAGSTAGANDFYAAQVEFLDDNPGETANVNDTQGMAQALTQDVDVDDPKIKHAYIVGNISPASDVDFYSFMVGANDVVTLGCGAQRTGSGLRGATFEILDSTMSLQSESEVDSADVSWRAMNGSKPAITAAGAGTFFFKVTTTSQDTTNTGNFYRCGIHVTSP